MNIQSDNLTLGICMRPKDRNDIFNQSGFSLILICFAVSLVALIILITSFSRDQQSLGAFEGRALDQADFNNLVGELSVVLSVRKACQLNLQNVSVPATGVPATVSQIRYGHNTLTQEPVASLQKTFRYHSLSIQKMEIAYKRDYVNSIKIAELTITAANANQRPFDTKIPIYFTGGTTITDCQSTRYLPDGSTVEDELCSLQTPGVVKKYDFTALSFLNRCI